MGTSYGARSIGRHRQAAFSKPLAVYSRRRPDTVAVATERKKKAHRSIQKAIVRRTRVAILEPDEDRSRQTSDAQTVITVPAPFDCGRGHVSPRHFPADTPQLGQLRNTILLENVETSSWLRPGPTGAA